MYLCNTTDILFAMFFIIIFLFFTPSSFVVIITIDQFSYFCVSKSVVFDFIALLSVFQICVYVRSYLSFFFVCVIWMISARCTCACTMLSVL